MRAIKRAVRLAAQSADKTRAENTGWQRKQTDAQQGDDRAEELAERRDRIDIAVADRRQRCDPPTTSRPECSKKRRAGLPARRGR